MDIERFLRRAIDEAVTESNDEDDRSDWEKRIRKEFNRRFEHLDLDNWILLVEAEKNKHETNYQRSSMLTSKWEYEGLRMWATHAVMTGHELVKTYRRIEGYLSELGPHWCCCIEKDDELIVLSNFKLRSTLVRGI